MNPHAIIIEPNPKTVKVKFNGILIAHSQKALILREGKLPPVLYLPREDVDLNRLQRTTHSTHCPFKGDAAYYTINAEGKKAENAVWTYESPISGVAEIKDHLGFYQEKVEVMEEEARG